MFERILFVCIGNICRSPMAEGLLKSRLANKVPHVHISSAGLGALVDKPAAATAQALLKAKGIDISQHKARQLTEQLAVEAGLILVMEQFQKKQIESKYPFSCGKVFLLGKWSDFEVPDPYRGSEDDFEYALKLIDRGIDDWLQRLYKN